MQKNDFIQMIQKTEFDNAIKQLLITSYTIGYDQGKIETLKEAIKKIDWFEFERKYS